MIKIAHTQNPVIELIKNRWSNRAFSQKQIPTEALETLFEAASWAPSSSNEQPWQYYFAQKNNAESFNLLLNCLVPGNQLWAKGADTIIASVARKTFAQNNNNNAFAKYDTAAANYGLLLQAQTMDIYGHIMAGYDAAKAKEILKLDDSQEIVVFLVLGYLGDANTLEEPFKARELTPRVRKSVKEFAFQF